MRRQDDQNSFQLLQHSFRRKTFFFLRPKFHPESKSRNRKFWKLKTEFQQIRSFRYTNSKSVKNLFWKGYLSQIFISIFVFNTVESKKTADDWIWTADIYLLTYFSSTCSTTVPRSLPPIDLCFLYKLNNFWKFLPTNFLTKVAQIFVDFLAYYEIHWL